MSEAIISSTLSSADDFENIFKEVNHDKSLGLKNNNHLKFFQLDMGDYDYKFERLQNFLEENIGSYVFSRAEIDGLIKKGLSRSIDLKAFKKLSKSGNIDSKGTGKELGEMLIYAFLEKILVAPKLLSKVELTSSGIINNTDSLHLNTIKSAEGERFQLVYGASAIVGDLCDAVSQIGTAINDIKNAKDNDYQLVEKSILTNSFDENTTERIKSLLIPNKSRITIPETAYGIFLGYTLGLQKKDRTPYEFSELVQQKIQSDIANNLSLLTKMIDDSGLSGLSFYIYLLPFNDAETDKYNIMSSVLGGND